MSKLTYNGIELELLTIPSIQREPVFSGQQYLYTRFVVTVRAVYNPNTNGAGSPPASYSQVQRGDPLKIGDSLAPVTDVAIRHALLVPRKPLLLTIGAHELIRSPSLSDPFNANSDQRTVDSAGGPKPLSCHVTKIGGIKTFLVEYSVETFLNEAPRYVQVPSYILSNVWKDSRQLDQDFYETRRVEGRAVFRRDRLEAAALFPDDFRRSLFHPITVGFKRENIVVVAEEDGNTLSYSFEDREKAVSLLTTNITRVEATHSRNIVKAGTADAVASGLGAAVSFNLLSPFSSLSGVASSVLSVVPLLKDTIHVKVWGNRQITTEQLSGVIVRVITQRLGQRVGNLTNQEFSVVQDLMGRYMEGSFSVTGSMANNALNIGAIRVPTFIFPNDQSIDGLTSTTPQQNPQPPSDSGTRGLSLTAAVAAALANTVDPFVSPVDRIRVDANPGA